MLRPMRLARNQQQKKLERILGDIFTMYYVLLFVSDQHMVPVYLKPYMSPALQTTRLEHTRKWKLPNNKQMQATQMVPKEEDAPQSRKVSFAASNKTEKGLDIKLTLGWEKPIRREG